MWPHQLPALPSPPCIACPLIHDITPTLLHPLHLAHLSIRDTMPTTLIAYPGATLVFRLGNQNRCVLQKASPTLSLAPCHLTCSLPSRSAPLCHATGAPTACLPPALSLGHHSLTFLPTHLLPALLLDPFPAACHRPPYLLVKCRGRMVIGCSPIAGFRIIHQCHYICTLNIECTESLNSTQIHHLWHCTKHD